jgi:acyl-homoserine-lactone acylase
MLSAELPEKISFADIRAGKLDTRCELADQFVDDLVAAAAAHGGASARRAAAVLAAWDRRADAASVGTLLFLQWATAVGPAGAGIGGFAAPLDDRRPLDTPRGFAEPARASTFSRTVWRLCGGAKGLGMWY